MDAVSQGRDPTTKGSTISWLLQEDYEGERGPKSIILPFGLHGGLPPPPAEILLVILRLQNWEEILKFGLPTV